MDSFCFVKLLPVHRMDSHTFLVYMGDSHEILVSKISNIYFLKRLASNDFPFRH